jgi:hypothetical protein
MGREKAHRQVLEVPSVEARRLHHPPSRKATEGRLIWK